MIWKIDLESGHADIKSTNIFIKNYSKVNITEKEVKEVIKNCEMCIKLEDLEKKPTLTRLKINEPFYRIQSM